MRAKKTIYLRQIVDLEKRGALPVRLKHQHSTQLADWLFWPRCMLNTTLNWNTGSRTLSKPYCTVSWLCRTCSKRSERTIMDTKNELIVFDCWCPSVYQLYHGNKDFLCIREFSWKLVAKHTSKPSITSTIPWWYVLHRECLRS